MRPLGPLPLASVVAFVLCVPAARAADPVEVPSRIVRVTVYPGRAEVVRAGEVRLPQGASEVVFAGLPMALETDSVRVEARGVAAAIGAVEVGTEVREAAASPELAAAEKEVRALEDQQRAIAQEETADAEALEFLRALRAVPAASAPGAAPAARPDPQAIQQSWVFLRAQLDELGKRALARAAQTRDLAEKLTLARARRDAARPKAGVQARRVAVALDARSAGTLALELTYVMPGANWTPSYRATLDAEKSEVALVTEGVVVQRTGEEWEDVELRLSTTSPARGVAPPVLAASVIGPRRPPVEFSADAIEQVQVKAGSLGRDFSMTVDGVSNVDPLTGYYQNTTNSYGGAAGGFGAVVTKADVIRTAYATVFAVPGRSTIPADAREHRVRLRSGVLPVTLSYRTVPSLAPTAYLVARGLASKDYPLLAGPVRVFSGPTYLGEVFHAESAPGAEIELPFGADDRVVVQRTATPEQHSREGFGGREDQVARAFRTQLENRRDHPVRVVVRDRVPVSQDERIVVRRGERTTAGWRDVADQPGVLEWDVTLAPGEKREIQLDYTIRAPKDVPFVESAT